MSFLETPACLAIELMRLGENGAFGQSTVTLKKRPSRFATQSSWDDPLFLGLRTKPNLESTALNWSQLNGGC